MVAAPRVTGGRRGGVLPGAVGPAGLGDLGGDGAQRGGDVVGLDLVDGALAAILGLVGALPQAAGDDDPAALGEGLGGVLGQLPPGGDGEEQGVAVLPLAGPVLVAGRAGDSAAEDGLAGV